MAFLVFSAFDLINLEFRQCGMWLYRILARAQSYEDTFSEKLCILCILIGCSKISTNKSAVKWA